MCFLHFLLIPALFCASTLVFAQTPCGSPACLYVGELAKSKSVVDGGPFENGRRVIATMAEGPVFTLRSQQDILHEVFTQHLLRKGLSMKHIAQVSGQQLREAICLNLPPSAWEKQLLANGGALRYVDISLDDIEFWQLDLTSCGNPVAVTLLNKGLAARYAKKNAQASYWADVKSPYVLTLGEGCSQWDYGIPAGLWGNRESVREAWTQGDTKMWGALTGFYSESQPSTFYFTKDAATCDSLKTLLKKAIL